MRIRQSLLSCFILIVISVAPVFAADLESSIAELAQSINAQMSEKQARKLAVVGFTDLNGYKSALGDFISEELITNLVNTGKFDIVERRELNRVLSEHEMYSEGIFDQSTIAELEKLLGIEAVITGSITNLGPQVKINSRSISVETGKIFAAASVKVDKDPIVEQLLNQAAGSTSSSAGAISGNRGFGVQRSDVYFKNSFLHVVLTGITITEGHQTGIQIATEFRNTTNKPLLLAIRDRPGSSASVISNAGDQFTRVSVTGIRLLRNPRDEPEYYTVIDAGSHATVLMSFTLSRQQKPQKVKGTLFSFTSEVLRWTDNGATSTSVGLSGASLN